MKNRKLLARFTLMAGWCLAAAAPAWCTTWIWSATFGTSGQPGYGTGSGTFTTLGPAVANSPLTVTGITGTFDGRLITALDSSYDGPDNEFEWTGISSSPLKVDFNGISFDVPGGNMANLAIGGSGFAAVTEVFDTWSVNYSGATSSNVSPIPEPSMVFPSIAALVLLMVRSRRVRPPVH